MELEKQSRMKSPIFWIGLIACVYQAVTASLIGGSIELFAPKTVAIIEAISVGLSAVLIYCNGNNPSLTVY